MKTYQVIAVYAMQVLKFVVKADSPEAARQRARSAARKALSFVIWEAA